MASGADTHTHKHTHTYTYTYTYTHTHTNTNTHIHADDPRRINFKKPGAPACSQHKPGLKCFIVV